MKNNFESGSVPQNESAGEGSTEKKGLEWARRVGGPESEALSKEALESARQWLSEVDPHWKVEMDRLGNLEFHFEDDTGKRIPGLEMGWSPGGSLETPDALRRFIDPVRGGWRSKMGMELKRLQREYQEKQGRNPGEKKPWFIRGD